MTNKEKIQKQIDGKPNGISQEDYDKLKGKNYRSGREIKIGDNLIFGFLAEYEEIKENEIPNLNLTLISFHPDEYETIYFDDPELIRADSTNNIPYLILK